MAKTPRLLRQTSTGRIYVATPAQEARADMVLLKPEEVELTGRGYVYVGSGRTGLTVPKPPPDPVAVPPPEDVPEPDPLQDSEPEPFVVDKNPSRMKTVELEKLAAEINLRFPEFAIEDGLKRAPMVKACTAALKKIMALAEQE